MKKLFCISLFLPLLLLTALTTLASVAVPRITLDETKVLLDNKDVVILDARAAGAWKSSTNKVKGALRASSDDYASWKDSYPKDSTIILYCS